MNLKPITNRVAVDGGKTRFALPEDGFVHLVPKGEFPHRASGKIQVIDDSALSALASSISGQLIDFDHFSYDPGKPSESAGWIDGAEVRDDGLYARVRWTDKGESALVNGRYRFISPVWLPGDVQELGGDRIRPRRLDTAGLTNQPNLRGMNPLANRGASSDASTGNENQGTRKMDELLKELGLSAGASEANAVKAVKALKKRADSAESKSEALKNRAETAEGAVRKAVEAQADAFVKRFENRISPEGMQAWRERYVEDPGGTEKLMAVLCSSDAGKGAGKETYLNRRDAGTPNGTAGVESAGDVESKAAARGRRATAIMNRDRVSWDQAWAMAESD